MAARRQEAYDLTHGMWAALRLVRATYLLVRIFLSYVLQLGLQKVLGRERMK